MNNSVNRAAGASGVKLDQRQEASSNFAQAKNQILNSETNNPQFKTTLAELKEQLKRIKSFSIKDDEAVVDSKDGDLRINLKAETWANQFYVYRSLIFTLITRLQADIDADEFMSSLEQKAAVKTKDPAAEHLKFDQIVAKVLAQGSTAVPKFEIPQHLLEGVEEAALKTLDIKRFIKPDGSLDKESLEQALKALPQKQVPDINTKLFKNLQNYYPGEMWQAYADDFHKALASGRRQELLVLITDTLNACFKILSSSNEFKQKISEDRGAWLEKINEKISSDFATSLVYFMNCREDGDSSKLPILVDALNSIDREKLFRELADINIAAMNKQLQKADISPGRSHELKTATAQQRIGTNRPSVLAIGANTAALSAANSAQLRLTGKTQEQTREKKQTLDLNPLFIELCPKYGLQFESLAKDFESAVDQAIEQSSDNLAQYCPRDILTSLDIAVNRDRQKTEANIPAELRLYEGLNEKKELLKLLATVLNRKELGAKFKKLGIEMMPSQLFIPQMMQRYFTENLSQGEKKKQTIADFNLVLDELEDSYEEFAGLREMIDYREQQDKASAEAGTIDNETIRINSLINGRQKDKNKLIRLNAALTAGVRHSLGYDFVDKAKVDGKSFLQRLLKTNYLTDDLNAILSQNRSEAKSEMIYLVTGIIVISPYERSNPNEIQVMENGQTKTVDCHYLETEYAEALPRLKARFHADAIAGADIGLGEIEDKDALGKTTFALLEASTDILTSGAGWNKDEFAQQLRTIKELALSPKLQATADTGSFASLDTDMNLPNPVSEQEIKDLQKRVTVLTDLVRLLAEKLDDEQVLEQLDGMLS